MRMRSGKLKDKSEHTKDSTAPVSESEDEQYEVLKEFVDFDMLWVMYRYNVKKYFNKLWYNI